MDALALDHVSVRLAGRLALADVSLAVEPGEIVGIVGGNGGGKTTLLRAALGLVPLASGEARLAGQPVARLSEPQRARLAAFLPQSRTVAWNLSARRLVSLGVTQPGRVDVDRAVTAALESLGVAGLADRGVLDMSGGERARVLIARMIVTGAPLLLADEPAAGLDPDAQFLVMDLLRAQADRGAAVAVSLHDLTLAARGCHRLAVLHRGRMMALDTPERALSPEILRTAFGLDGELIATSRGLVVAVSRR